MKVGLISCVKTKRKKSCEAKDLYISDLFKKSLAYSLQNYDKTYILSAKYGFLELTDIIEPYELTLKNQNEEFKKKWSYKVFLKIIERHNINTTTFYFLCGENYRKYLIKKLIYKIPLQGLRNGKQLEFYKKNIKKYE